MLARKILPSLSGRSVAPTQPELYQSRLGQREWLLAVRDSQFRLELRFRANTHSLVLFPDLIAKASQSD